MERPTGVGVTIAVAPDDGGLPRFEVRFANRGERPATIILPQDGSTHGWLSPEYVFSIQRVADGVATEPLLRRCGNHGAAYDASTMRTIPPDGAVSVVVRAPHDLVEPGEYRATLTYSVEAGKYPGPHYAFPPPRTYSFGPWPSGVFVGELESNAVTFER